MGISRIFIACSLSVVVGGLAAGPACNCQRAENVEAKRRLGEPLPPDPMMKAAEEKLDPSAVATDEKLRARISRMSIGEAAARLSSFTFTSKAELSFQRGDQVVRSSERTRIQQAATGDFSVDTGTGDNSEQKLAYVNGVFFLKNNNGTWRMSRDPSGERNQQRDDAGASWSTFFDLFEHTLTATTAGRGTHEGRDVVKYRLSLPDQSASARAEGAALPPLPKAADTADAGTADVPEEKPEAKSARMVDRISKWRSRAKPAGGQGELYVDGTSGVPVFVRFQGALLVGDGPEPARLDVTLEQSFSGVGKSLEIRAPKDAVAEVVRRKLPTSPRTLLEEEGIVAPLPQDAGPAGAPKKKKPAAEAATAPAEARPEDVE